MKITFLGTGADTAYPLPFCLCNNCIKARELGDKNLRKRSSIIINKDLIIDLGPDIMSSSFVTNISIADIRYWLQTHSHADHFDPSHIQTRIPEYAGINTPPLELYASKASIYKMSEMIKVNGCVSDLLNQEEQKRLNLKVNMVRPAQILTIGNYEIRAFSANHDKSVESLLYSIKNGNKTAFYATDTDEFSEETWITLQNAKSKFDIVMLDHTYGPNVKGGGHLNANAFEKHIKLMADLNLIGNRTQIYATHISHEGNPIHAELVKYGKIHGYQIAFDGLVVEA